MLELVKQMIKLGMLSLSLHSKLLIALCKPLEMSELSLEGLGRCIKWQPLH